MKLLVGPAVLSLAMLAFAGSEKESDIISCDPGVSVYQDTIPKKDTSKKDRKKDKQKRDIMYYRY